MEFRIGDRDPETGLYNVIYPDGSATRNGLKIFNAEHQFGDVVLAHERSDGMIILDGVKAAEIATTLTSISTKIGYLNGQVFNIDDDLVLPILSIDFAPNSPILLKRSQGFFSIRISLDRVQSQDIKFKISLSGEAEYLVDYTVSVNPQEAITIEAGQKSATIGITPISYGLDEFNDDIVVTLEPSRSYRIGIGSVTMEIAPTLFHYKIHRIFEGENMSGGIATWPVVAEGGGAIIPVNLAAYETAWTSATTGFDLQDSTYGYFSLNTIFGETFSSFFAVGYNYFGIVYGSNSSGLDVQLYREDYIL